MIDIKEKVLQPLNIVMHYAKDGDTITVSARIYKIRHFEFWTFIQLGDISKTIFLRIDTSDGMREHIYSGTLIVAKGKKKNNHIVVQTLEVIKKEPYAMEIKEHQKAQKRLLLKNQLYSVIREFMSQQGFLYIDGHNTEAFTFLNLLLDVPRAFGFGDKLRFYASYSNGVELWKLTELLLNTIQYQLKRKLEPLTIPDMDVKKYNLHIFYKKEEIVKINCSDIMGNIGLPHSEVEMNLEKLLTGLMKSPIMGKE